jgi:hypothetical protein
MPHDRALYHWQGRLATRLPELPESHRRWLAWASYGVALAGTAAVTAVALHLALALALPAATALQRLRELYRPAERKPGHRRGAFDHAACFAPLLRWAAGDAPRVALALDPTDLAGRLRVLAVSLLYGRCAIPVAWDVRPINAPGSWNDAWGELLDALRGALGEGREVLVLTDRGLESPDLFRAIVARGWHPLMRAKAAGHFRPEGWGRGRPMGRFAAAEGRRWKGPGVAYPGGSRLACTLLACREPGHAEPWLVLTDLAPAAADASWYGRRGWIEAGFKRLKSGGWRIEACRMAEADRAARWLAAAALATLWALESAGGDAPLSRPGRPGRTPCGAGLFRLGATRLRVLLGRDEPVVPGRWRDPGWAIDPRPSDRLDEDLWGQAAPS